jgi:hypothetical protein
VTHHAKTASHQGSRFTFPHRQVFPYFVPTGSFCTLLWFLEYVK